MNGDEVQGEAIEEFVNEYFPRDAVQVLEDLRIAQHQVWPIGDVEANMLLTSLRLAIGSDYN